MASRRAPVTSRANPTFSSSVTRRACGVSAAAITSSLPLAEPTGADQAYFSIEGRAALSESEEPTAHTSIVSLGYFRTMGIRLLQGLRDELASCIGCGCLSLERCRLRNPGDRAAGLGPGPRDHLVDDPQHAPRTLPAT